MQTAGSIAGEIEIEQGAPRRVDLTLTTSRSTTARAISRWRRWNGAAHWHADAARCDDRSALRWRGGALFGLAIGAAICNSAPAAGSSGCCSRRAFRCSTARSIWRASASATPARRGRVHGRRDAASRSTCSSCARRSAGRSSAGRSAASISKLRMREGVVTLGTTLRAQVFDGKVMISDLRLEQPFGQWPRFYSNIALENLDLELVTGAFSFGRITGRLSGAIDGLQLFNWTPVAFDARLYTPPDDRSKHRISQRAVENIGSIGGGGRASPRRCRADSCASSTTSTTTGSDCPAGLRTKFARWTASRRRRTAATTWSKARACRASTSSAARDGSTGRGWCNS